MKVPIRSRLVPVGAELSLVMRWLGGVDDAGGEATCAPAGPVRVGDGVCGVLGAALLVEVVAVLVFSDGVAGGFVGWLVVMTKSPAQVLPIVLHRNVSPSESRFGLQSVVSWLIVPHLLQV